MWLRDDWEGADFIAVHTDGETFLKVQLKGRLTFRKKYTGKNVFIAFNDHGQWYLYPHDELQTRLLESGLMSGTESWDKLGGYSWPGIPKKLRGLLEEYKI